MYVLKSILVKTRIIQWATALELVLVFVITELAMDSTKMPCLSSISARVLIGILTVYISTFATKVLTDMRTNLFAIAVFIFALSLIIGIFTLALHGIQIFLGYEAFEFIPIIFFTAIVFLELFVINTVVSKIINSLKFSTLIVHSSACEQRFVNKLVMDGKLYGDTADFVADDLSDETFKRFKEELKNHEKIIFLDDLDKAVKYKLSFEAIDKNRVVQTLPDVHSLLYMSGTFSNIGDTPFLSIKVRDVFWVERILKRVFDFVASAIALVLLSPVFLICALAIKLEDHGPVFYKQERYTNFKRRFNVYKFRSMRTDAEKFGAMYAQENDPRITKVGKIIRALRVDELPQLINILKGEMSFVGPRPERPVFADEYSEIIKNYDLRFLMKAGLTGYAQVCGKYNTNIRDKQLYDIIYISKFTILFDLGILLRTIIVVFTKEATAGYENGTELTQTAKDNANKQEVTSNE